MIECAACRRLFPEVMGAPTQRCPHCQHEQASVAAETSSATAPVARADPVAALSGAWAHARRRYHVLLALWLPALAVDLAAVYVLAFYERSAGLEGARLTTGQAMQYLGVALPLYLGVFTVKLASWSLVAAEPAGALRATLRRWPLLLLMGFMLLLTYLAGFALVLVGFLVFFHWFLYVPAIVADGEASPARAFERSRAFAREHKTAGFTALVLLLGLLVLVLAGLLTLALGGVGIAEVAGPVASWLVSPFLALLPATYWRIAKDARPVAAPAPLERTGRTRCPKCATLIRHDARAGPIDVTCPSCGYSGRVL